MEQGYRDKEYTLTEDGEPRKFTAANDLAAAQWLIDRYDIGQMAVIETEDDTEIRIAQTDNVLNAYDTARDLLTSEEPFHVLLQKDKEGKVELWHFVTVLHKGRINIGNVKGKRNGSRDE